MSRILRHLDTTLRRLSALFIIIGVVATVGFGLAESCGGPVAEHSDPSPSSGGATTESECLSDSEQSWISRVYVAIEGVAVADIAELTSLLREDPTLLGDDTWRGLMDNAMLTVQASRDTLVSLSDAPSARSWRVAELNRGIAQHASLAVQNMSLGIEQGNARLIELAIDSLGMMGAGILANDILIRSLCE
ncbi:MAG: hypothetical protein F4150_03950 [Chloroflexi bacterium]|nr:hypothetical protein [Chloroflexota bacterium]